MKRSICFLPLFLCACTTPPVSDTDEYASSFFSGCGDFELTQDCSNWNGATRKRSIDGFLVQVAASTDGHKILIMDAHLIKNTISDTWRFHIGEDKHSTYVNESYHVIKVLLTIKNVSILQTTRIGQFGEIDGYLIELDSDGYSVLLANADVVEDDT